MVKVIWKENGITHSKEFFYLVEAILFQEVLLKKGINSEREW